jgi:NAD(P)H-hydrate epimerase
LPAAEAGTSAAVASGNEMEVLTGDQMRRVDRRTIDQLGIPGLLLMESAGRGVAEQILRDFPDAASRKVVVLCGKGNNGGDGLCASRHLARLGASPRVLLFGRAEELTGDAAVNLVAARASGLRVEEVLTAEDWTRHLFLLRPGTIVLDALLGTGVVGGARGLLAEVIEDLNEAEATVLSVDLPSGLDANSSQVSGPAVRAHRTYTLCRPKLPLVLKPAADWTGSWVVIPIGVPDAVVAEERPELEWLDPEAVGSLLPQRSPEAHKGSFGHLLAVAGSRGKAGAAVLLARAALRSGVGLVTVATARSVRPEVACQQAELMTEPLPETRQGAISRAAPGAIGRLLQGRDALAIGPGLGAAAETSAAVRELLRRPALPAVLDADGLNAYAGDRARKPSLPKAGRHPLVLTPHPGEASRLLRTSTAEVQEDRLASGRKLAAATGAVVVLKGHRTVVAHPDGRAAINSTGNPGMATAGTGDVLTGIIGAFLARKLTAWDAARLAVFVHGDAGDRAARAVGEEALTAGDVLNFLPEALSGVAARREPRRW